jgi:hypothetical protein
LLVFWIPFLNLIFAAERWTAEQLILLDGVHVDANMFTHEANSHRVSETPDFERFPCHLAVLWPGDEC